MEDDSEDDSGLNQYVPRNVEDEIQDLLNEQDIKARWAKEISENAALQAYFENFNSHSVTSFVSSYITYKYIWVKYSAMYKNKVERDMSKWIDLAHDHLEPILQKQLFDLQCRWRANDVKIEGVEICYDFQVWERNIFNCPFLAPITEAEIAMYQDYLLKGEVEGDLTYPEREWQNYNEMKEEYGTENSDYNLHGWYEFHNVRTGNSRLFLLPDIRGEKEEFYLSLNREERAKNAPPTPPCTYDSRPYLSFYDAEQLAYIVQNFEDRVTQKGHYYYTEANKGKDNEEFYEELVRDMLDAGEPIPIKACNDFREAMELAYKEYKCKKIAEHLPLAHQQYLFNKQMGFGTEEKDNFMKELRKMHSDAILEGRAINGEPRDFNF